ncbi:MAG: hypothetical protein JSV62_03290 [Promethearchaeota archaeon]|nr:MAG: hypothetical protein JSV62_03290 [Candidatus Lokiarchaeota archaeon]
MSLWKKIFKNEIRQKTYRFRENRKLFFILIYTIFLFWAIYLGPVLFDAILPEIIKNFSSQIIPIFSNLIEYSFMIMFLLYIMYPIFMLYRKSEIGYKEILLASPVKSGDIFIGEFLGQMPFYFLFILAIGPLVNSLLIQLNPNLTFIHYIIFYIVIFVLLILGLLIGSFIANWLENRIVVKEKSSNSKFSLVILLSLVLITFFYLFHFLFDFISDYPELKNWITIYPSYWYSNIILYIIDPILVESYVVNIWVSIILVIIIPLIVFYLSYKRANIFYGIEHNNFSNQILVRRERKIYQVIRKFSPHGYKTQISTQFKEFFRKKENFPKLIYVSAFTALLGLFVFFSLETPFLEIGDTWIISSYIVQIFYFRPLLMIVLSWMGGLIFGMFIGIYILFSSKDLVFLYKKSIRGIKTLIYSFFYEMFYIIMFLDIGLTIFFSILFPLDFLSAFTFFLFYPLITLIILMQAIGIQCFRTMFDEKGKNVYFNIYLIIMFQIISLLIATFFITPSADNFIDHSLGLLYILFTSLGLSFGIALLSITLGIRRLNQLE